MNLQEIFRWIVFGLLIVHFLISATMWIINDNGKSSSILKSNISFKGLCELLKNNSKVYLLSVIIFGVSILFISLVLFEKPVNEGYSQTNRKIKNYFKNLGTAFSGQNNQENNNQQPENLNNASQ